MNDQENPTRSTPDLDARIAGLSPEKRALLRDRIARREGVVAEPPAPITQAPPGTDAPLSFAQQRLWFMEEWAGGGALYNIASAWWIEGSLAVERLRGAFGKVVARHEGLRTALVSEQGQAYQQVLAELELEMPIVDLSDREPEPARSRALALAHELAGQSFDLARPPLLRVTLYRVTKSTHLLVLVMHHIVSDGWSMGVLCRELSACYAGDGAQLPALPLQYSDYARWQRAERQGVAQERQLAYWRKHLAGLATLDLPTDRPRPPTPSYRGAHHDFVLPSALSEALRQSAQREHVTLYMLLLAAFQVLLHRYSGQDDIVVGTPVAGRTRIELEGLIGFFVNTLVLRTDVSGNPRFCDLLGRVRETALDAFANQDVAFEKLVEVLVSGRDLSRNPLFQVMFVLQNTPGGGLAFPALTVAAQKLDTATAKFDLTLELTEDAGGLNGSLAYATDLFDADTIERMAEHFSNLLAAVVADPQTSVATLSLLSPAERQEMLADWDETIVDSAVVRCVHELCAQQAARRPEALALICDGQRLRYAELNARANQLAHHLIALGVGPEVPVGICLEHSFELVIGLLAILKAGGAYVPLDAAHPQMRLAFMLTDTAAPVLLTAKSLLGRLPPFAGHTLCLERDWPLISTQSRLDPPSRARARDLAYIIYTSGSTGTPKGVMVTHANVARLFVATQPWFGFDERDIWTCFHSPAFDFSVWEIWGALVHGGSLVLIPHLVGRNPDAFHALLRREHVTVLNQTPSAFQMLMAADARVDAAAGLALRLVIFGGEALHLPSLRPWFDRHEDTQPRLVNMYGITETTVHVTYRPIRRSDTRAFTGSMIGERIPDLRLCLLDRHLQLVPKGVAGEVFVGGAGVARGYLNRAELTAERFIADPFSDRPDARVYRSGDLARRTSSGDLEYLGRVDDQVKLRGFRVELGEIEATLMEDDRVRRALVLLREDTTGDSRLVAYVVAVEPTQGLDLDGLRAKLRRRLPDYMIPAAFVELPALPLTPNGKIDRKALPAPTTAGNVHATHEDGNRDNITVHLTRIWEILLGRNPIGSDENFFDVGGNSLLAVQLIDQIEKTFRRRLPLDTLWFHGGTIRVLASLIHDEYRSCANPDLVVMRAGSRRPLFVLHTRGGYLLNYYELSRHFGDDQPVFGLQARGVFGTEPPERSVETIAANCVESMRAAQPAGPYLLAGFSSGGVIAYEMAQQLTAAGEQVALLAMLDTHAPQRVTAKLWFGTLVASLTGQTNLSRLREVTYFALLHSVGLGRLRKLHTAAPAHRWAHWSYRPKPYVHPIEFFVVAESTPKERASLLGWSHLIRGPVLVHQLPGNHMGLVEAPAVIALATLLQERIDRVGQT